MKRLLALLLAMGVLVTAAPVLLDQARDTPHPDKSPKEIDSLYTSGPASGKTVKGIYKIEGDTITYCWAEPDKDRPKEFESKSGAGVTLMVLKRVKEEDKDKDKDKD